MSKYTVRTQAEILRTAPTKDGLFAVSSDTHKIFISYNGKWNYKNEQDFLLNPGEEKSQGEEIHKTSDIDGHSSVIGLSSGSPVGWWKSTDIFGLGKPAGHGEPINYWKSLINDFAWVKMGTSTAAYGGGNTFLSYLTTYPSVFPAVRLGNTNSYGMLFLNKSIPKTSPPLGEAGGATYFIVARSSDNFTALIYNPSLFWDYASGPWRWLGTGFSSSGEATSNKGTKTGDSSRPAVWAGRFNFPAVSTSDGSANLWMNGVDVGSSSGSYTSRAEYYSQPILGYHAESSSWGCRHAYLYEIIIYNQALSDTDIDTVQNYLIDKYHSGE